MARETSSVPAVWWERVAAYPLVDALLARRSRRFGYGMRLNGGPLAYDSAHPPVPLSEDEEAGLAFAACGLTGPALAELPYQNGGRPEAGSGNILAHLIGRTVPSGDAIHAVSLFVIDDEGAWMLKRPQDVPRDEIANLVQLGREHRFVDLYRKNRVQVADRRPMSPTGRRSCRPSTAGPRMFPGRATSSPSPS